jgi:membrane-anchored mycosin MYCP
MTPAAGRGLRIGTAVLSVAMGTWTAPVAGAVTPPAVDHSLLPPPSSPAPPAATEPIGACHPVAHAGRSSGPMQLTTLGIPTLRPLSRGSGQTVAVIDTGVARHRLLPRLTAGGDYVATGDGTQDCDGHGTIVAGIIAAVPVDDAADAFGGIAPDAGIIAIRQSSNQFRRSDGGSAPGVGDVDTLAMAVRTAADLGATVINISSVACGSATDGLFDGALGAALAYAVDVKNVVVVSAAGNVGGPGQCAQQNGTPDPTRTGRPDWDDVTVVVSPAWYDDYVLTVGSIGPDGHPSPFTLAGPWVDVAAPGESVVSLSTEGDGLVDTVAGSGDAKPIAGTSYAAPVVSGVAALIRARAPYLTARQVMRRIEDTAHHPPAGWDPLVGFGVVDPLAALSADGEPQAPGHPAAPAVPRPVDAEPVDPRVRTVALGGAAACLAVATAAVTLSTGWLRRRREPVTHD